MKFRKCWRKSNKEECQYFDLSAVEGYDSETNSPFVVEVLYYGGITKGLVTMFEKSFEEYYTTKNPNLIEELKELSVSIVSMCDRVDEINEELKQ